MRLNDLLRNYKYREEIFKGWSDERKFYIEDMEEDKYLLRLIPLSKIDEKAVEYKRIKLFNRLKINMSQALDFGKYDEEYCYMLLSFVEGEDLNDKILEYSEREQYILGKKAGKYNKDINSIKIEESYRPKNNIFYHSRKIGRYRNGNINVSNDEVVLKYIEKNIDKLGTLGNVYRHGDYHMGNLVVDNEKLGIIDFNRQRIGNYQEEFTKNQFFNREKSIPFAIGMIDGYFGDVEPDESFWEIVALYCAIYSLTSINWAESFGDKEVEAMKNRYKMAYDDYEGYSIIIPKWYSENRARFKDN